MSFLEDFFDLLGGLAEKQHEAGPHDDLYAGLKPKKPIDGFMEAISTWEGTWQNQPQDVGNWVYNPETKQRHLIGTMRGVTPAAYAQWKGIKPWEVTADMLHNGVTLEVAAQIGMKGYYRGPGFDRLPYVPATEVWCDIGWGSGPVFAVQRMQTMIGVAVDGKVGPLTVKAYAEWVRTKGHEETVRQIHNWRSLFYHRIAKGSKSIYLRGWMNRANYYLPSNTKWWATWTG